MKRSYFTAFVVLLGASYSQISVTKIDVRRIISTKCSTGLPGRVVDASRRTSGIKPVGHLGDLNLCSRRHK